MDDDLTFPGYDWFFQPYREPYNFPRRPPRGPNDPMVRAALSGRAPAKRPSRPYSEFLPNYQTVGQYRSGDAEIIVNGQKTTFEKEYAAGRVKVMGGLAGRGGGINPTAALVTLLVTGGAGFFGGNQSPRREYFVGDSTDTVPRGTGSILDPFWWLDRALKSLPTRTPRTNRPGKSRTGTGVETRPPVIEERPELPEYNEDGTLAVPEGYDPYTGRKHMPGDVIDDYGRVWNDPEYPNRYKRDIERGVKREVGRTEPLHPENYPDDQFADSARSASRTAQKTLPTTKPAASTKPPIWQQVLGYGVDLAKEYLKSRPRSQPRRANPSTFVPIDPELVPTALQPKTADLTGLNYGSIPFPLTQTSPKLSRDKCECPPKAKKKGKKGCTNPVISRTTREGIRTTKTRIVCPSSKPKSPFSR